MIRYQAYETLSAVAAVNVAMTEPMTWFGHGGPLADRFPGGRHLAALHETVAGLQLTHVRPPFGIEGFEEQVVDRTPFAGLVRMVSDRPPPGPPVLVVAPLSGHFATLVRNTVRELVKDHDVYVTDWYNARDIPLSAGRFGLDEYADHVVRFLGAMGEGSHVLAVCQSCVPALVATAVMAEDGDPAVPRTLTLMAGPIDARVNPTEVNHFAMSRPLWWFERSVITRVPFTRRGAMRRVYPGFLQVSAFINMNRTRHVKAHVGIFRDLVAGNRAAAANIQDFYAEYFAVLDMTAEFYLETVDRVFQRHDLPLGRMTHHGRLVDPAAITRTGLLTIEGENDDICSIGQTMAAHDLCTGVRPSHRAHHLQPGVGHYGVFSGRRWQSQIYPHVRSFVRDHEPSAAHRAV